MSNTTVTLIDPAAGLATANTKWVTIAGQGVYTYNPWCIDLLIQTGIHKQIQHQSVTFFTEVLTGLTDPMVVTMTYAEQPPVANDDSSLAMQ